MQTLRDWADSRCTSIEVAQAIQEFARNRTGDGVCLEEAMQTLWENPTDDEMGIIESTAARKMLAPDEDDVLYWGEHRIRVVDVAPSDD